MPVPITWRSCRSMIRPSSRSLSRRIISTSAAPRPALRSGGSSANRSTGRSVARANLARRTSPGAPRGGTVTSRIRSAGTWAPHASRTRRTSWRAANPAAARVGPAAGSRTPATNSVQLVEAPMTTPCCHAETRVRPRSRTPTTTKTRWSASPRRTRWTCRGRHRPSSSSEIDDPVAGVCRDLVEQPVEGSRHRQVAARHPLAEEVEGRRPLCVRAAAGRGRRWRRGRPRVRRARTGSWSCPSWADRRAGRRQPWSFPPPPASASSAVPAPSMPPVPHWVRVHDTFRPVVARLTGGPPIEHTLHRRRPPTGGRSACVHPWAPVPTHLRSTT